MTKYLCAGIVLLTLAALIISAGCDKERIVQSTEKIHDIEYIHDTIYRIDTVKHTDSVTVPKIDTVTVRVTDTVRTVSYVHDTVVTTRWNYDTVVVIDTVIQIKYTPTAAMAVNAMQNYTNPMVYDYIAQQLGLSGGWVFYLASDQMEITTQSSTVYDIYSYVDYWAEDWSGYYPLEVFWRLTYKGTGDPSDPDNWIMADPPSAAPGHQPGVKASPKATSGHQLMR